MKTVEFKYRNKVWSEFAKDAKMRKNIVKSLISNQNPVDPHDEESQEWLYEAETNYREKKMISRAHHVSYAFMKGRKFSDCETLYDYPKKESNDKTSYALKCQRYQDQFHILAYASSYLISDSKRDDFWNWVEDAAS